MSSLAPKPKVVAAVVGGIIASAVLSNISLITPDLFTGLGKASGLVYGLTITLIIGVCGWLKSDGAPSDPQKDATASDTPSVPQPDASPATSFAATQAKLDALAPLPEQPYVPLDKPADTATTTIA
ncbi:hypothetical protein AB4Z38_07160 [Arthrobacter sp. 2RAF6]|uniref:hypothetical protein n=1 Tax=Arthrobacter sp. 2RAF6 TaxID=3233002 RepID=UPI003F8F9A55